MFVNVRARFEHQGNEMKEAQAGRPGTDSLCPPADSNLRSWVKFILVLTSALIALGLCEAALRLRWSPAESVSDEDTAWQLRWLRQRRARSRERLSSANPLVVFSPTLGWRPASNQRVGGLTLNSHGVRGAQEINYDKPPDEKRIVVVGNSYAFGVRFAPDQPHVADHEIFTHFLEQGLSGTRVINLGVPGYGTDQQLLRLREEGFRYAPDLVIVAVFTDDLRRALLSFRDYAKPWFEVENGQLVLRGVPVPAPERLDEHLKPRMPRLYLWSLVEKAFVPWANEVAPLGALEVDRINEAIFDTLDREVRQQGARLLVVVIPDHAFTEDWDRSEEFLRDWGQRRDVPTLLLREPFSALAQEDRRRLAVEHWTPYGHRVVADAVLKKIRESGLMRSGPASKSVSLRGL